MILGCPNHQCDHVRGVHDYYDEEDRFPTCCVEGCECPSRPSLLAEIRRLETELAAWPRAWQDMTP